MLLPVTSSFLKDLHSSRTCFANIMCAPSGEQAITSCEFTQHTLNTLHEFSEFTLLLRGSQWGGYMEQICLPRITILRLIVGQLTVCWASSFLAPHICPRQIYYSKFAVIFQTTGLRFHTVVNKSRSLISRHQPRVLLAETTTELAALSAVASMN